MRTFRRGLQRNRTDARMIRMRWPKRRLQVMMLRVCAGAVVVGAKPRLTLYAEGYC